MEPQRSQDFAEHDLICSAVFARNDRLRQSVPRRQTAADLAQLVANAASAKGDGPRGIYIEREPHASLMRHGVRAAGRARQSRPAQRDAARNQPVATGEGLPRLTGNGMAELKTLSGS